MDNSSQWPQGFGVVKTTVDHHHHHHHPSSSSAGSIDQQHQQKRTITLASRPQKDQIVNCPRCNSVNTKFCYYNNYSLSQPRYFCKTCRRYWTAGGSLRNVPVGGGSRKNRRSSSSATSNSLTAAAQQQAQAAAVAINLSSSSISLHQAHQADLNLSFPPPHLKPASFNIDQLSSSSKLFSHLPNPNTTSITPLLPPMGLFKNSHLGNESRDQMMRSIMMSGSSQPHHTSTASIFSSAGFPQMHHQDHQFKPSSISFSLGDDGYASSCLQLGVQQNSSDGARLLFPFNQDNQNLNKDQQQVSTGAALLASSDNNVQFDLPNPRSSSVQGGGSGADPHGSSTAGFWTGMLSGSGSW